MQMKFISGVTFLATLLLAPSTASNCRDVEIIDADGNLVGWHDIFGSVYDCNSYRDNNLCGEVAEGYSNYGYTANTACCACGGGVTASNCRDVEVIDADGNLVGWHDTIYSPEYDCKYYMVHNLCGNGISNYGHTANTACCACGGGVCIDGYIGPPSCEVRRCDSLCQNGGTCNQEDGSCTCVPGFSGIDCEVDNRPEICANYNNQV